MINTDTTNTAMGTKVAARGDTQAQDTVTDNTLGSDRQALHEASVSQNNSIPKAPAKTLHIRKPLGHVAPAALICGLTGALVAGVLDFIHAFDSIYNAVKTAYVSKPFYLEATEETWQRSWDWVIGFLLAWAVAYVALDSEGKGRRIFIGSIVLLLIAVFSPLMMLWGVLWVPIAEIVAVTFALICALIYTSQHVMPCELGTRMKKVRPSLAERARIRKHKRQSTPLKKSRLVRMLEKPSKMKAKLASKKKAKLAMSATEASKASKEIEAASQGFQPLEKENTDTNTEEKSTDAPT